MTMQTAQQHDDERVLAQMREVENRQRLADERFPTVEDALASLGALAHHILVQDHCGTHNALFEVQQLVTECGFTDGYEEFTVWVDEEGAELSDQDVLDCLADAAGDDEDVPTELDPDDDEPLEGVRRVGCRREWRHVQTFLTFDGAQRYLSVNAHNLGRCRIYAGTSFRNAELLDLRDALIRLSSAGVLPWPEHRAVDETTEGVADDT